MPPTACPEPSPYIQSLSSSTGLVLPTTQTTRYFADFSSVYFHPKSLQVVGSAHPVVSNSATASQLTSFETSGMPGRSTFDAGQAAFAARNGSQDVLDTEFRPWLEECDGLQAVQLFTSSDDAWAGFGASYVEHLHDELGKSSLWVWGLDSTVGGAGGFQHGACTLAERREKALNSALALREIADQATLYIPLSIPSILPTAIEIERDSLWHTTGLLNAAAESVTLPLRLRGEAADLTAAGQWEQLLEDGGRRKIAGLRFAPDSEEKVTAGEAVDPRTRAFASIAVGEDQEPDSREDFGVNLFPPPFAPSGRRLGRRDKRFASIYAHRDVSSADPISLVDRRPNHEPSSRSVATSPLVGMLLNCLRHFTPLAYPLPPPFPRIFDGYSPSTKAIPTRTTLATSSSIAAWVRSFQHGVQSGIGLGPLAGDEQEAVANGLAEMAEAYLEGWSSDSEDDDD